jgi:hypothetical protein
MKNMRQKLSIKNMQLQFCYTNEKKETRYQPVRTARVQAWKNGPYQPEEERTPLLKTLKVLYHLAQLA